MSEQMNYEPLSWMKERRHSFCNVLSGRGGFFVDDQEVSKEAYEAVWNTQHESDRAIRREREFTVAEDAFAYAESLDDGVVLDWGRRYAAMEREGLKIGFVDEPHDQPIVTREDFTVRAGPSYILVRRGVSGGLGGCSTDFTDPSKSWSEDTVEVLDDGTGNHEKGQWLLVRVYGSMGVRASVGRNWRMKLLKPEDVKAELPVKTTAPTEHG